MKLFLCCLLIATASCTAELGSGRLDHELSDEPASCDGEPEPPDPCEGSFCGDGTCQNDCGEDTDKCIVDCGTPPDPCEGSYCGDGSCQGDCGEDADSCSTDCGTPPDPCEGSYCGDGTCRDDCGEDADSCSADCGGPPNPCEGIDLSSDPGNCGTCGNACPAAQNCVAGSCHPLGCGDGLCTEILGETKTTCPEDCGAVVCGDGVCEYDETVESCADDCSPTCWDGSRESDWNGCGCPPECDPVPVDPGALACFNALECRRSMCYHDVCVGDGGVLANLACGSLTLIDIAGCALP